ncbi:MAG: hypothetical protein OQK82_02020 [Candidatus Pacearchaeota archaeon]|nr:hypothetical protein [Candidatus Pacearchaeota archaeon]
MKKRFGYCFLTVVLCLSLVGAVENLVSENINCIFKDSDREESCFNYFSYGAIELPKSEDGSLLQYNCDGKGKCSMTVTGEQGAELKWASSCNELHPRDTMVEIFPRLKSTVINGNDKIITFECNRASFLTRLFSFFASAFDIISSTGKEQLYKNRLGYRDLYYLCYDGTENVLDNSAPICKSPDEWDSEITQKLCKNLCDAGGIKCGYVSSGYSDICLLDEPSKDFEKELRENYSID